MAKLKVYSIFLVFLSFTTRGLMAQNTIDLGATAGFSSFNLKPTGQVTVHQGWPVSLFAHYQVSLGPSLALGLGAGAEYMRSSQTKTSADVNIDHLRLGPEMKISLESIQSLLLFSRFGISYHRASNAIVTTGYSFHWLVGAGLKDTLPGIVPIIEGGMLAGNLADSGVVSRQSILGVKVNLGILIRI